MDLEHHKEALQHWSEEEDDDEEDDDDSDTDYENYYGNGNKMMNLAASNMDSFVKILDGLNNGSVYVTELECNCGCSDHQELDTEVKMDFFHET